MDDNEILMQFLVNERLREARAISARRTALGLPHGGERISEGARWRGQWGRWWRAALGAVVAARAPRPAP
jgi:hypothetical protein